jgi:hypothetical protein
MLAVALYLMRLCFTLCGSSSICVTLVRITRPIRARGNSTPARPTCCPIGSA